MINSAIRAALTLHQDLSDGLDDAQAAHGHTGVVRRLPHAIELQHVAPNGHLVLRGQVLGAQHPLDVGHGRTHGHTGDVDAPARHDLVVGGEDGKTRGHAAHWEKGGEPGGRVEKRWGVLGVGVRLGEEAERLGGRSEERKKELGEGESERERQEEEEEEGREQDGD